MRKNHDACSDQDSANACKMIKTQLLQTWRIWCWFGISSTVAEALASFGLCTG
jgi:hypothetical protein